MRRAITIGIIAALAAASVALPADAAKKKKKKAPPKRTERTVEGRYEFPAAIGSSSAGGVCFGCPAFPAGPGELWVKIEIDDDVTPKAGIEFSPGDLDGDGFQDTGIFVCGATEGWVQILEGAQMQTFPWLLPGADCPDGSATMGTIKITYSNLPGA